ncbi:hypothetical protein Neosp_003142 [[Neocosmospora] mangrovei]
MADISKAVTSEKVQRVDDPSPASDSDTIVAVVQEKPKSTWKSYLWDTFDKSPEERRFLFKLDAALMTLASLGYFIKYLDQVNINNAFVSGMKEDLNLMGNELNYMQTCWTVGYVLGEIPSWYRKDELAKRSCLFHAMGNVGSMVSGYLMAGSHNLDGVHGFHGWQWLFITNTIVSLPIAISGFFFLPDLPEITKIWYLTKDEIALAKKRMQLEGRAERAPYTKAKFVKIFSSWHIYALTLLYILFNNGNGGSSQPAFPIWLKEQGYTIQEVNIYPTIVEVISIVTTLIYAWTSDSLFRGARWPAILFSGLVKIIAYAGLTVWNVPNAFTWACFMLCGFGGGISGLTFAWAHEICSDDNEERALVTGAMNEMAYVFQAWLPLVIWQQVEAPVYPKGYPTMVGMAVALIGTAFAIRYLHKKEQRGRHALAGPA